MLYVVGIHIYFTITAFYLLNYIIHNPWVMLYDSLGELDSLECGIKLTTRPLVLQSNVFHCQHISQLVFPFLLCLLSSWDPLA